MKYPTLLLLCLFLIFPKGTLAKDTRYTNFNYPISAHKIKIQDFHYSYINVSKNTFLKEGGHFLSLLSDDKKYQDDDKFVLVRAVFPIKKSIGYFGPEKFSSPEFIKKLSKAQKVKKINEKSFLIQSSFPIKHHYFSKFHFDSDDVSSLPGSKIGRKISDLKSSDPVLLSSSAVIYRESFGFSDFAKESSEFISFIGLDENITLVVLVKLIVFPPNNNLDYAIERDSIKEVKMLKKVFEKY